MPLIGQPPNGPVDENGTAVSTGWANFFSTVGSLLNAMTLSGTTAKRPTTMLWVGRPYFDTTLGYEIWLRSIGPVVWVNGAGAPV